MLSQKTSFSKKQWTLIVSFIIGLMLIASCFTAAGMMLGVNFAKYNDVTSELLTLNADSAARGKAVSLATGQIDENVEGLFILDHITGDIQCWVLNSRTGGVAAIYKSNVAIELGNEKTGDADYVMTTGRFNFDGGNQGNTRPGRCICYVADGNSGKAIGYGLTYNKQAILRGGAQGGTLSVVCRGIIRGTVERDQ